MLAQGDIHAWVGRPTPTFKGKKSVHLILSRFSILSESVLNHSILLSNKMQTESDPATAYNYWAYIRMAFESI
jgi:hypothetical protein